MHLLYKELHQSFIDHENFKSFSHRKCSFPYLLCNCSKRYAPASKPAPILSLMDGFNNLALNFTAICTTSCTYHIIVGLIQNQLFQNGFILIGDTQAGTSWSKHSLGDVSSDKETLIAFITLKSPSPLNLQLNHPSQHIVNV